MLGQLCEGVLYGIGLAGGLNEMEKSLSAEVREVVNDLGEIARIDVSTLSTEDSDLEQLEQDLMELVEFVKVGVLMLNEELSPTQAAPIMDLDDETTVH